MRRIRLPRGQLTLPPHPGPTPLPRDVLLAHADEVRDLVDELAPLTRADHTWGVRTLRRNTEIALRNPRTLESPENQMDFIEELAESVWAGAEPGDPHVVRRGEIPRQVQADVVRLHQLQDRLDQMAVLLCEHVVRWRRQACAAAGEGPRSAGPSPQVRHWI